MAALDAHFRTLVETYADIKAILITDRDGVILLKVEQPNLPAKVTKAALSATFSLSCDQATKLGMGKALMVMSAFDEYQINTNEGLLIEIGSQLKNEVLIIGNAVVAA
ncbi:Roadblock/LC7 domain-containing protein [Rhizoclosmatium globosum]|uniref:Roadblock/LC7 domain-containing protein n=1 Tax=Rhizoclosmatium globosum TaxID=329046 RepID=A0A1Y2BVQ6_9FUNG|nr:Roadblock/LC7 domain-containing protein [Rhizoclosmatium globosum]|eukprot:ORY38841.1 Roadblock/LC7 domain-containing protein [Rhizoclosmatium globosum]